MLNNLGITSVRQIGKTLGIPKSTVGSFLNSYERHGTINPKRGSRPKISDEIKQNVIKGVEDDPFLPLIAQSKQFDLSHDSIRKIRHEFKYYYYDMTPVPPLTPLHIQKRIDYCNYILNNPNLTIVFTDESTICQDLAHGGIWRKRGHYPPESFYSKEAHPLSVMVWGGISKNGFRTPLIRCPRSVTALSYCQFLAEHHILALCKNALGEFTRQQDGAPSHQAVSELMKNHVPSMVAWSPHSPDLSPIERVWNYLKIKIKGKRFSSEDELFQTLVQEWNSIPNDVIQNFWESHLARCIVCKEIGGQCLNGHWKRVREVHQSYARN